MGQAAAELVLTSAGDRVLHPRLC